MELEAALSNFDNVLTAVVGEIQSSLGERERPSASAPAAFPEAEEIASVLSTLGRLTSESDSRAVDYLDSVREAIS